MAEIIQIRGGTATEWTTANPILAHREIGIEMGTPNKIKIGDGLTDWITLGYFASGSTIGDATDTVKGIIQLAGDLGGTAAAPTVPGLTLKADLVGGKVPASQLPVIVSGTAIISGSATWSGTGLIFDITDCNYIILGTVYASAATAITLATADATNPRIDTIYLDNTGNVGVHIGTPAVTPVKPQVDPSSEVELSLVLIPAGATVPSGITNQVFFDEGTESTGTSDATGVNFNYTSGSFSGLKNTLVGSFTAGKFLQYAKGTIFYSSDYQFIKFYIKLPVAFSSTTFLSLYLKNGDLTTSIALNITSGQFGFNRSLLAVWQLITIPVSSLSLTSNAFNSIYFRLNGSAPSGFQLDFLYLQSGNTGSTPNGVQSFAGRTGNVTPLPGDYTPTFIGAESIANKGIANGYAPLNASSQVPAANLPSYVDDVLEFANLAAFPVTGETGKIYIDIATSLTYRWSGSVYVQVGGGSTGAGFIKLTSANFTDSTHYNNAAITGKEIAVFWNDIPRYLEEGVDYDITLTGINITIPDFNSTINSYRIIIQFQ